MINLNDLIIGIKPLFVKLSSEDQICKIGDILEIRINFDHIKGLKLKINIQKETHLQNTVLILPNNNNKQSLKNLTAQAALLGYENCHQYQRENLNLAVCIEKML